MLYAFQVADSLLRSGAARRILIVGAEAHAASCPGAIGTCSTARAIDARPPKTGSARRATAAGRSSSATAPARWSSSAAKNPASGVLAVDLQSDGRYAPLLCIPAGFREHPYLSERDARARGEPAFTWTGARSSSTPSPSCRAASRLCARARGTAARRHRLVRRAPGEPAHQRGRVPAPARSHREDAVEHRSLRQHFGRDDPDPARRDAPRRPPRRPASSSACSRSARASTGAACCFAPERRILRLRRSNGWGEAASPRRARSLGRPESRSAPVDTSPRKTGEPGAGCHLFGDDAGRLRSSTTSGQDQVAERSNYRSARLCKN